MIFVDANTLLYAPDKLSPYHARARKWWDLQLSGTADVCLCWTVINAFIRIGTNSRIYEHPLSLDEALLRVQSWFDQSCVKNVVPSENHWKIFQQQLVDSNAAGNLVTDAHLAALAIELGCVLQSTDSDFARFPKLKWNNPLF